MKFIFSLLFILSFSAAFCTETTLLLVRHGQTRWNAEERVQGKSDIPLNAKGVAQAKKTACKLIAAYPAVKAIYSSDLSRAYYTAVETADKLHLPIVTSPCLREIDAGSTEGMLKTEKIALYKDKWKELERQYPDKRVRWNYTPVPGEESISDLIKRIEGQLTAIAVAHPNETVAIFTHGKVIQSLIADIEEGEVGEVAIPNGAIVEVLYDSENCTQPFRLVKIRKL